MSRRFAAEKNNVEKLRIEEEREAIYDNPPNPSDDVEINVTNALKWHLKWEWT